MDRLKLLEALTTADGMSGYEKEASRVMKNWMSPYVDVIDYDGLGSIIGIKKGTKDGLKIMLAGHLDEVGFMVSQIDEQGYLKVHPVGGWWGHVLPSQLVTITTHDGRKYPAVFGSQAPHGMPEAIRNKVQDVKDLYLDLGVYTKQEVLDLGIQIGDMVTPKSEFTVMANPDFILAKAFDDRVGAAIIVEVLERLSHRPLNNTIFGVGTTQEEVGLRGAKTAASHVQPDLAIALDVTLSQDAPGKKGDAKLGVGAVLSIKDASVIAHTGLLRYMETLCQKEGISFTYDILAAGGTDSGAMSLNGSGVVNMTLSIPARYVHSHRSMVNLKDIEATVSLLTAFCLQVTKDDLKALHESKR